MSLDAFEDKNHEGNSSKHHTGDTCIEGCGNPAGTLWSPHWCFECNVKRMKRIHASFALMQKQLDEQKEWL